MDKSELEQLKKLVADLDKNLTRLKMFIDQHDEEDLLGSFGFPKLDSTARPPMRRPLTDMFPPIPKDTSTPRDRNVARDMNAPRYTGDSRDAQMMPPLNQPYDSGPFQSPVRQPAPQPEPKPAPVQETSTVLSPVSITDEAEGPFDGQFLTKADGTKIEVPASYASKTRILYGDIVKTYKENGEQKFKVTTKQPKKSVKALTVKREGKWYVISGTGSYKISDSTAEFNNLGLNQEVIVLVPEANTTAPFAAFDQIVDQSTQPKETKPQETKPQEKSENKTVSTKNNSNVRPNPPTNTNTAPPKQTTAPTEKSKPDKANSPNVSGNIDPALKVIEDFDLV